MDPTTGWYLAGAGAALALVILVILKGRRRQASDGTANAFKALGIDARTIAQRGASPPVDLSRPISGDAAWKAIRAHASDAAYRRAVETVRLRYQIVSNPMLLPNTLREVMQRSGMTFREAMLRVAESDGVGGHR